MSDPTAGRPDRPRPRPAHAAVPDAASSVPDGGIPVTLPAPLTGPRRPKRPGKVRRFLRTRRGKWIVAATVAVIAVLAGLLGSGFLSSPAPPLKDAPPLAGGGLDSLSPTPSASGTGTTGAAKTNKPANAADIRKALQDKVGSVDNPLNSLRSAGEHKVSITVSSTQPLQVVGYLVPTSINTNYAFGTAKPKRPTFAINTTAVGSGYLAAVFVQADKTGAPVRCVVTIDGKTTNSETTGGPYGRQVCLG